MGSAEPTTTFDGRWFHLSDAVCEPKPVQSHLPLLIGAKGDRMLALAARFADRWNAWGLPAVIAEVVADYAQVGLDELIVPDFVLGSGSQRLEALDALHEEFVGIA